ncbi:Hypothetical protein A7982_02475 [Minicystis rosea]|nr:Hypothetical protein A7982_02475 [Minicystis rosea]
MRRALGRSIGALAAAREADIDRSDVERAFFLAEQQKLEPLALELRDAHVALEAFDRGPGEILQARVEIGDEVLDRGVRTGNARTKVALRGSTGLDATHVFGNRVDDLTGAAITLEPGLVLAAVSRFDDVAEFPEKNALKQDLAVRAKQQDTFLKERDAGESERVKLQSAAVRLVVEAALALASLKGALDQRFPRQRKYVETFFLDVAPKRTKKPSDPQ